MSGPKKNEVVFDDDYDDDDSERLSVWEAAEIWGSNGKDEEGTLKKSWRMLCNRKRLPIIGNKSMIGRINRMIPM